MMFMLIFGTCYMYMLTYLVLNIIFNKDIEQVFAANNRTNLS